MYDLSYFMFIVVYVCFMSLAYINLITARKSNQGNQGYSGNQKNVMQGQSQYMENSLLDF